MKGTKIIMEFDKSPQRINLAKLAEFLVRPLLDAKHLRHLSVSVNSIQRIEVKSFVTPQEQQQAFQLSCMHIELSTTSSKGVQTSEHIMFEVVDQKVVTENLLTPSALTKVKANFPSKTIPGNFRCRFLFHRQTRAEQTEFGLRCPLVSKISPNANGGVLIIGQPTEQTTGARYHLASRFIPDTMRTKLDTGQDYTKNWNQAVLYFAGRLLRKYYHWKLRNMFPATRMPENNMDNFPKLGAKPRPKQPQATHQIEGVTFVSSILQLGESEIWTETEIRKAAKWTRPDFGACCQSSHRMPPELEEKVASLLGSIGFHYYTTPLLSVGDWIFSGFSKEANLNVPCVSEGQYTAKSTRIAHFIPIEMSGFETFCAGCYIPTHVMDLCPG